MKTRTCGNPTGFDKSVCTRFRYFRLIGSTKPGQNRPLKPAPYHETVENQAEFFVSRATFVESQDYINLQVESRKKVFAFIDRCNKADEERTEKVLKTQSQIEDVDFEEDFDDEENELRGRPKKEVDAETFSPRIKFLNQFVNRPFPI